MKKLIVSIVVLLASTVCVLTADKSDQKDSKDLRKVKQEAAKTFAEGKSYYIWYTGDKPAKPTGVALKGPQCWSMAFGYLAKEKEGGVPMRAVLMMPYKDPQSGAEGQVKRGTVLAGYEKNPSGEGRAIFMAVENRTEGKAEAKLYLIKEVGAPADQNDGDPISNTITIPVLAPAAGAKKP